MVLVFDADDDGHYFRDMSNQKEIFTYTVGHFGSEQEEMRAAAAFAAGEDTFWTRECFFCLFFFCEGNIAIGNLHQFLPVIVKMVENDPKKRLLALHAAKEVSWLVFCIHLSYTKNATIRLSLIVHKASWKV